MVAIIGSSLATSELFQETCPYSVYRKDRNLRGGGVNLLVHKVTEQMAVIEFDSITESVWAKVFVNQIHTA